MTNNYKTALLVGASGLVGNELLHILLESTIYQTLTIFVRKRLNIDHPKLVQIEVDLTNLKPSKDFSL